MARRKRQPAASHDVPDTMPSAAEQCEDDPVIQAPVTQPVQPLRWSVTLDGLMVAGEQPVLIIEADSAEAAQQEFARRMGINGIPERPYKVEPA